MKASKLTIWFASLCLMTTAFSAVEVTRNVYLIPGAYPEDSQPDGNSILLSGTSGAIVIDTGRHAKHAEEIVAFARAHREPIRAVINTHWHLDHIGGNGLIRRAYPNAKIYATSALKDALHGFLRDYKQQLQDALKTTQDEKTRQAYRSELAIIDAGPELAPDVILKEATNLVLAGRSLDVHVEHAATAGDVWLIDRKSQTAIVGDLVTLPVPFFDTACPEQWRAALRYISAASFTTLIPGHGAPMTRYEFEKYRHAFDALLQCAASTETPSVCSAQWQRDVGSLLKDEPRRVDAMLDYYFKNILRSPVAGRKYCAASE